MQLSSVLFNAKYTTYLIIILLLFQTSFGTPIWAHFHYNFFLILKIYQKHIIMGIFFFQLPRSLPKFLIRLPFFPVLVLTILLVPGSDSHFILNNS